MWKQVAEFPIWKWFFFSLTWRMKRRAVMALVFFSTTLCTRCCWLAVPPSLWRQNCGAELGKLSRDQPLCRLPPAAWQHFSVGKGSVASPLAYLALGLQTGNTLAPGSRDLLAFSTWIMRLGVFDLPHGGGSQLVCPWGGAAPWQVAGGLWEQLNKEAWQCPGTL